MVEFHNNKIRWGGGLGRLQNIVLFPFGKAQELVKNFPLNKQAFAVSAAPW